MNSEPSKAKMPLIPVIEIPPCIISNRLSDASSRCELLLNDKSNADNPSIEFSLFNLEGNPHEILNISGEQEERSSIKKIDSVSTIFEEENSQLALTNDDTKFFLSEENRHEGENSDEE